MGPDLLPFRYAVPVVRAGAVGPPSEGGQLPVADFQAST